MNDELNGHYERWIYSQKSSLNPSFPMLTEILYSICEQNDWKFERVVKIIENAYVAGYNQATYNQAEKGTP